MKKLLLPLIYLLIATSCSTIKVTSDYDKEAPFTDYKTYMYAPDVANLAIDDINKARIMKAVDDQMALKGFIKSEKPDVLIDLKLNSKQIQTATANQNYYGSGYGYRWGGGFSTTTIDVQQYTEGTLFVDMIDVAKNQLVWQGRGVGTINPDASATKRESNINYSIKKIFTEYPPKLMK